MEFLSPIWLYCLAFPVLLVIGSCLAYRRYQRDWSTFVSDPRLAERLVKRESSAGWWVTTALIFLGLVFLFIALAEPVNGKEVIESPTKGKKIYIAMDLSRSMLVEDIAPNRLTKAQTLGIELIEAFPSEQIGIVSFSGKAWLEAPLTSDHNVLIENLLELNEESVPYGGSDGDSLMELFINMETEEEALPSEALVVIFSDGEFHDPVDTRKVEKAREKGFRFYTIGVGTNAGGVVPDRREPDGKFRDRQGRTIISMLKTKPLETIANVGGGSAFLDDNYNFVPRIKSAIAGLQGSEVTVKSRIIYNHLFQYFLLPALLFFTLACISTKMIRLLKHIFAVGVIGIILQPHDLKAQHLIVSFNQANKALKNDDFEQAIEAYDDALPRATKENRRKIHFSKGTAEYKKGDFPAAIESFSQSLLSDDPSLQAESHYNLGNTNFKNGEKILESISEKKKITIRDIIENRQRTIQEWENSLGHYRGTLQVTPDHPNARENYDYVKDKLDKLKEEQENLMEMIQQMQKGQQEGDCQDGDCEGGECEDCQGGEGNGEPQSDGFTPDELRKKLEEEQQKNGEGGQEERDKPGNGREEGDESNGGDEPESQNEGGRGGENMSPEEAQKMLEESGDLESGNLRTGRQRYFRAPLKDW